MLAALLLAGALQAPVDFARDIKPVIEAQCLSCHGNEKALGGFRFDTAEAAMKAIVPGSPDKSRFFTSIELPPGKPRAMPPGGARLPSADREKIRQWIAAGAAWPKDAVLRGARAARGKDDLVLAQRLHARFTANSASAPFNPYKASIAGTDVSFEMLPIQTGEFLMGTPPSEPERRKDEGPQRKVRVDAFWMGKHEVTWDEYRLFMFSQQAGENVLKDALVDAISRPTRPYVEMSFGMGLNGFPAISMTQHAANKYAQWLSARTGHFYRLPTEAEWEYACRAGTTTAYSFGDDDSKLGDYAWFAENSQEKYQKVGTKKPNAWGLHDMHGNAMEWTLDQHAPYAGDGGANPWVKASKPYPHAVRGGAWTDDASRLRCGARVGSDPTWKMQDPQLPKSIWYHTDAQGLGFRLVRPVKLPSAQEMFAYWNNGVERE